MVFRIKGEEKGGLFHRGRRPMGEWIVLVVRQHQLVGGPAAPGYVQIISPIEK